MIYVPDTQEERDFLASYDPSKFPITVVTVDVVLFDTHSKSVLLIERANFPYRGHFALPGGFIDRDETVRQSAIRELREETGIDFSATPTKLWEVGVADDPYRDPRGRAISHVFVGGFDSSEQTPKAGDDAASVHLVRLHDVEHLPVAFDHAYWIRMAKEYFPIDFVEAKV